MHQLISKEDAAGVDWLIERHLAFAVWRAIMASLPVLIFGSRRVRLLKTYAIQRRQSADSVEGRNQKDFIHGLSMVGSSTVTT